MAADVVEATCPRCGCALVRDDEPHAKGDGPARRRFLKRARTHGDGAPLENIHGLGPASAQKLAKAGITDTEQLLAADARALHEETGIARADLVRWQDMCDLLHLKGIGVPEATALVKAKVNSVAELAMQDPGTLAARLQTPRDDGMDDGPDLRLVTAWVKEARKAAPPPRSGARDALRRAADDPEVPEDPVVTPAGVVAGAAFDDATFRAECPRCAEGFHVARGTLEGACPYCGHGHAFQADGDLAEREHVDDARLAEDAVREAEQGFLRRFARRVRDGDRTAKTVTKQRPAQPSAPRPSLFRRRAKGDEKAEPGDGDASKGQPAAGAVDTTVGEERPAEEKAEEAGGKKAEKRPTAPKEKGRERSPVPLIGITCAHCGGAFRVKSTQRKASCPHCHSRLSLLPEEEEEGGPTPGAAGQDARLEERRDRARIQGEKRAEREQLRKRRQEERRSQRAAKAEAKRRKEETPLPAGAEAAAPAAKPERGRRRKETPKATKDAKATEDAKPEGGGKGSLFGTAARSADDAAQAEEKAEKRRQKEAAQELAQQDADAKAKEREAAKQARARVREDAKAARARKKEEQAAERAKEAAERKQADGKASEEKAAPSGAGDKKPSRAAARRDAQDAKRREKAERRAKAEAERREAEKARIAGLRSDSLWERAVAGSMAPEEKEAGTWERSVAQGTGHRRRDSWAGVDGERLFARQERSGPQKVRLVDGRSLFEKLDADEKQHDPPRLPDARSAFARLPEDEREEIPAPRLPDGRSPFEPLPEDEHADLDRLRAFGHRPGEAYTTRGGFRVVEEVVVAETPRERELGSDRAALRRRQREEEQRRRAEEKEAGQRRTAAAREEAAKRRAERSKDGGGGLLQRGKRSGSSAATEADRRPDEEGGAREANAQEATPAAAAGQQGTQAVASGPSGTGGTEGRAGLKRLFGGGPGRQKQTAPGGQDAQVRDPVAKASDAGGGPGEVIAPGVVPAAERRAEEKERAARKTKEQAQAAQSGREAAKEADAREARAKAEAEARLAQDKAKEKAEAAERRREQAAKAKLERTEARRRAAEEKAAAATRRREEREEAKTERKRERERAAEEKAQAAERAAKQKRRAEAEAAGRPRGAAPSPGGDHDDALRHAMHPGKQDDAADGPAGKKARKPKRPDKASMAKEADRRKPAERERQPARPPAAARPSSAAPPPDNEKEKADDRRSGEEHGPRKARPEPQRDRGDLDRRVDDLLRRRSG